MELPGPGGYVADFVDEGIMVAVRFRHSAARGRSNYAWQGASKVFGERVEWHLFGRVPRSAVLRIWRAGSGVDGGGRDVQALVVFKIGRERSCRVASLDARSPDANRAAALVAAKISTHRCSDDEPP